MRPIVEALASIEGCYSRVQTFDIGDPEALWKGYSPSLPIYANDLVAMQPGRGYWIYATVPCTLSVVP